MRWTDEEKEILKRMYPNHTRTNIRAALGMRAWNTICAKAMEFGLRRRFKTRVDGIQSRHPLLRALRRYRIQKKITRRDLAARLGYNETTLANWESGRHTPAFNCLIDWADGLGLALTFQVKDEPAAKPWRSRYEMKVPPPADLRYEDFDARDVARWRQPRNDRRTG
jgi:transcriptional regulator with XRE-family HTH domain